MKGDQKSQPRSLSDRPTTQPTNWWFDHVKERHQKKELLHLKMHIIRNRPRFVWHLILLISFCPSSVVVVHALVSVHPVVSTQDVLRLADLRYDEWIATTRQEQQDRTDNHIRPIRREAFRAGTLEIFQERASAATCFLATLDDDDDNDDNNNSAVGAAELSAWELRGAITFYASASNSNIDNHETLTGSESICPLYVTDVVTARSHRRQGVARTIMEAVERAAQEKGADYLLLHVAQTNAAAIAFYHSLDYATNFPEPLARRLDPGKLAENAGVQSDQILLHKKIIPLPISTRWQKEGQTSEKPIRKLRRTRIAGGGGFQKKM